MENQNTHENTSTTNPNISVVMPCYNVENYVEKALNSVFNQTYPYFEIICLNDGSTDNTLSVLNDFSLSHGNMTVIDNENHHQGYERNVGIEYATGKYIYFMDSDDTIAPDCFEVLINYLEKNNLDLIYFEGTAIFDNDELENIHNNYKTMYHREKIYEGIYNGKDLFIELRKNGDYIVSPCMQMAKREFVLNNNIRFPELPCMEDNFYNLSVCLLAERVMVISNALYFRYVHNESTMTRKDSFLQNYYSYLYLFAMVSEKYVSTADDELQKTLMGLCYSYLSNMKKTYTDHKNEITQSDISKIGLPPELTAEINIKHLSNVCAMYNQTIIDDKEKYIEICNKKSELNNRLHQYILKLNNIKEQKTETVQKLKKANVKIKALNQKLELVNEENSKKDAEIKQLQKEIKNIKNSTSFKVGKIIMWIPIHIKRLITGR